MRAIFTPLGVLAAEAAATLEVPAVLGVTLIGAVDGEVTVGGVGKRALQFVSGKTPVRGAVPSQQIANKSGCGGVEVQLFETFGPETRNRYRIRENRAAI
jgi:hypothetical protein